MSLDEKKQLQEIRDAVMFEATYDGDDDEWGDEPAPPDVSYKPNDAVVFDEVLRGERMFDPSHHGGEFRELLETMAEELAPKRYLNFDLALPSPMKYTLQEDASQGVSHTT
jgi:hypothetical protein